MGFGQAWADRATASIQPCGQARPRPAGCAVAGIFGAQRMNAGRRERGPTTRRASPARCSRTARLRPPVDRPRRPGRRQSPQAALLQRRSEPMESRQELKTRSASPTKELCHSPHRCSSAAQLRPPADWPRRPGSKTAPAGSAIAKVSPVSAVSNPIRGGRAEDLAPSPTRGSHSALSEAAAMPGNPAQTRPSLANTRGLASCALRAPCVTRRGSSQRTRKEPSP